MSGAGRLNRIRKILGRRKVRMVVVRESNESNELLFDGMREQTYLRLRDIPEVEAIRQMGMLPMTCGTSFMLRVTDKSGSRDIEVRVQTIPCGSSSVRVFSHGGWVHVWSMASAAKETEAGLNAFTDVLISQIREHKPAEIHAANISRLVRSQRQAALLLAELLNKVETVWAGAIPFTFKGAGAQHGTMFFTVLAMIASTEREWIVQRLLCGKIAQWRQGRWPWGDSTVPFGYDFDPDQRKLVVREDLREAVREMLIILSQRNIVDSELVRQLGDIGVTSPRAMTEGEERRNIALSADPSTAIDTLFAWAPLWIAGEYLMRHVNGFEGLEELNGVTVIRSGEDEVYRQLEELGLGQITDAIKGLGDSEGEALHLDETVNDMLNEVFQKVDGDHGEFQLLYKFDVPDGGWAEQDVLDAFAVAARRRHEELAGRRTSMRPVSQMVKATSPIADLHAVLLSPSVARGNDTKANANRDAARAHRLIPVFAGRSWNGDGWEYEMFMSTKGVYQLRAWPAGTDPLQAPAAEATAGVEAASWDAELALLSSEVGVL